MSGDNVHTLSVYGVPLCVVCLSCGHRATLESDRLTAHSNIGDMVSLAYLSRYLKCSACGSHATKSFRPHDREEAKAFMDSRLAIQ